MYKMLRDSGLSVVGAALMTIYVTLIAGPLLAFGDWYGKNYVGEAIDDYPEFPGPLELADNQTLVNDNLTDCPPVGSKEWDDWIEHMDRRE